MQFVDKHNNLTGAVTDCLEHLLQALFKFTTEFGASHQSCQIQSIQGLVLQALGHVACHDAAGQALGDGSLANARLADKHRVILFTATQDFDHATNFFIAANYRVQLTILSLSRQILTVFFQGLFGFFVCSGVLILHPSGLNLLFVNTIFAEQRNNIIVAVASNGGYHVPHGNFTLGILVKQSHHAGKASAHHQLTVLTLDAGDFFYQSLRILGEGCFINMQALQQIFKEALAATQSNQHMGSAQLLVVTHYSLLLGCF